MVDSLNGLKAAAFRLSKFLAARGIKLSSQQCLDALAHAHLNQPYEAALATQGRRKRERVDEDDTLSRWLDSAAAFCKVVSVLDEEAMNTGAWPGHHHKGREIQPDGRAFLRAAGAAAAAFEAGARAYVERIATTKLFSDFVFQVETGEPAYDSVLAMLRVLHRPTPPANRFVPLDFRRFSERLQFGAEARIEMLALMDPAKPDPRKLSPQVRVSFVVTGKAALSWFADMLEDSGLTTTVWPSAPLTVQTSLSLMKGNAEDLLEDEWSTDADPTGARLIAFCRDACARSDEETENREPMFEMTRNLDHDSSESELYNAFAAVCAHALFMPGKSGGWSEIMATPEAQAVLAQVRQGIR